VSSAVSDNRCKRHRDGKVAKAKGQAACRSFANRSSRAVRMALSLAVRRVEIVDNHKK
jgi:lipocalin